MSELTYSSITSGERFELETDDIWFGSALPLRSRRRGYEMAHHRLSNKGRPAVEVKIEGVVSDNLSMLDRMLSAMEADLSVYDSGGEPGVLSAYTSEGQKWSQHALFPSDEAVRRGTNHGELNLNCILLDGVWRHELPSVSFVPISRSESIWGNLPTNFPANLAPMASSETITNPCLIPTPWRMVIYGPAFNPHLSIAGNNYQINTTVPDGARLEIDSLEGEKSVTLIDVNGARTDMFNAALRGRGINGGDYIFQPIPAGDNIVNWPNSFGFDLTLIEERTAPPWT